jgi:ribosomal protein S18 acetylase RimI-like enzyme
MSEYVDYRVNQANAFQISQHLRGCDTNFIQTLNNRVSIDDYSKKIAERAVRFEAWVEGALVGLVAMYCNDQERHFTYITSVSMSRGWQAKGIASVLMSRCIKYAADLGGLQIGLEVRQENAVAVNFYRKFGFEIDESDGPVNRMTRKLEARKP